MDTLSRSTPNLEVAWCAVEHAAVAAHLVACTGSESLEACCNIAEGAGRVSKADKARAVTIAVARAAKHSRPSRRSRSRTSPVRPLSKTSRGASRW